MVDGKPCVLLPRDEYDRLTTLAKAADLPPLPEPDAHGNYPAVEYARASLASRIEWQKAVYNDRGRAIVDRGGVR